MFNFTNNIYCDMYYGYSGPPLGYVEVVLVNITVTNGPTKDIAVLASDINLNLNKYRSYREKLYVKLKLGVERVYKRKCVINDFYISSITDEKFKTYPLISCKNI